MKRATALLIVFAALAAPYTYAGKRDPKTSRDIRAKLAEGKKLAEQGQLAEAEATFREGYETYQDPEFLIFSANALLKLQRYEEAKATFQKYLAEAKKPKNAGEIKELIAEIDAILETSVTIETTPPKAKLWLDTQVDAPLGVAPFSGKILPGSHVVIAELPGYALTRFPFEAVRGDSTNVKVTLELAPSPLTVKTEPAGAELYIDGQLVGKTPYQGELKVGKHAIEAKKSGFGALSLTAEAKDAAPVALSGKLPPPPATLVVKARGKADAELFLDGVSLGSAESRHEIAPGDHSLTVRAQGFRPFETKISALSGKSLVVEAELKAGGISLLIKSNVEGAAVRINGDSLSAESPVYLSAGKAAVEIVKPGYLPYKETLEISEDGDFTLDVTLKKRGPRVAGFAAMGVAGGALGVGGAFGVAALVNDRKFRQVPTPELLATIERQARLADIGFGVAGAAALGAAGMLMTQGGLEGHSPGRLSPAVTPGGAGLAFAVDF
jgi:hypothetical protein